ncbi:MAG: TIGR03960 family B12-binding radical SAM protein [Phycisphaerae bacterium]
MKVNLNKQTSAFDSTLAQRVRDEVLPFVRQPAQYIGGEVNQLVKPGDWAAADVRVVIGFPDAYTIGMSHLGCQILYWLCNHTDGVCAERTYAPWIDAEAVMREKNVPLFTWDTRQPVGECDIFAISLQYELCFTTVLNMLDLAGIPHLSAERTDEHPLVIVGGPQADNPEPMADFVDLVVIGDGEHSMAAILDAYKEYKAAGVGRRDMIAKMAARFPWMYAPNLYDVSYHEDGTIAGLIPKLPGLPTQIERCKTPDFDVAPFPRKPLVPWVEVVHDRIGIEIMRGCPQVCRFCHAGYTKRPLHYRTVDRILEIAEEAFHATGHHEISLLSLSTADYPLLPELAKRMNERFAPRMVNLSFPSLRVDKMLAHIPAMGSGVRRGSITMAVEAARDDMRKAIRKKVTDGNLLEGVRAVYKAGWRKLKLYFMAGFPGERDDDIAAIYDLCEQISMERCKLGLGQPGTVIASVGWLVPKPFTPLQWMAQPREAYFDAVREKLRQFSRGMISASGSYAGVEREAELLPASHATEAPAEKMQPRRHGGTEKNSIREGEAPAEPLASDRLRAGPPPEGSTDRLRAGPLPEGSTDRLRAGPLPEGSTDRLRTGPLPEGIADRLRAGPPLDSDRSGRGENSRKAFRKGKRKARPEVTLRTHDARRSVLEAVFARGDRRLGATVLAAWKNGSRFDAWDEGYDHEAWRRAFESTGVDPAWYAHRERGYDEVLPWEHIGLHMRREFLEKGYDDMFAQINVPKPEAALKPTNRATLPTGARTLPVL